MDVDIWLPLATLLAGCGLAQITKVLKDRRAGSRDRLARQVELQRNALLSLQDALLELSTAANAARHADVIATMLVPYDEEKSEEYMANARDSYRKTIDQIGQLLRERY
jgi:hypothetical protein